MPKKSQSVHWVLNSGSSMLDSSNPKVAGCRTFVVHVVKKVSSLCILSRFFKLSGVTDDICTRRNSEFRFVFMNDFEAILQKHIEMMRQHNWVKNLFQRSLQWIKLLLDFIIRNTLMIAHFVRYFFFLSVIFRFIFSVAGIMTTKKRVKLRKFTAIFRCCAFALCLFRVEPDDTIKSIIV